jgi:hypothetical protein
MLDVPSQLFTRKISSDLATTCEGETTNLSSCLFCLTLDEEQLRTRVCAVDTSFVRETYLNLVEYHPLTPYHLEEQCSETYSRTIMYHFAPSMTAFTRPTRSWMTPKVCATVIRASPWVSRSNLWKMVSISLSPSNFLMKLSVVH